MYTISFYICLFASVTLVVALIWLAIYPIKLPLVKIQSPQPRVRIHKARSPTNRQVFSNWEIWDDDEDDL